MSRFRKYRCQRKAIAAGAGAEVLQDPLRHTRELLAVLDDELAANRLDMPNDARNALEELRAGLAELDSGPVTRH